MFTSLYIIIGISFIAADYENNDKLFFLPDKWYKRWPIIILIWPGILFFNLRK